jgi:pimeloyl-ACP methyl ester carboxylesterase
MSSVCTSEPFRERAVEVSGIRLRVRECGEGDPLLLINGLGAHIDMWAWLEHALPHTRLIAFDAPGTGRSGTPFLPLGLNSLAQLSERLLDRLGYGRVDVLGYSFGGLIAQYLAHRAPERIRRLVLAATTPGWGGVPGSAWTQSQMATPLRYYWPTYHEQVIGELMGGRARYDRDFVRRHGEIRRVFPPTPYGYLWQLLALAVDAGTLGWLKQVTAQTLVVTGDDDPVMPLGNALLLAHYIPRARLAVAPGEGHLLLLDDRSRCLPVIRNFLSAATVSRSRVWREAITVDAEMLEDALRGAPPNHPTALMSALVRQFHRARKPSASRSQSTPTSSIGTPSASSPRAAIE